MGSHQRGSIYQEVKTNKTGSKVTVSALKGAEITNTNPQRGRTSIPASTPRTAAGSVSPSGHRRSDPAHSVIPSSSDYHRSFSLQAGSSISGTPIPRGTENRSKSEAYRHSSLQRKIQQTHTPASPAAQMQRTISPVREESTRRWGESKSGRNRHSVADPKPSHRLSFIDQKGNIQTFQEDPPSKVQYPQGVRVPRKTSVYPKDEAVQTEPVRRSVTAAEIRSPRKPSSPEHGSSRICVDSRTAQRRLPGQESEIGRQSSVSAEPKTLHRNKDVESDLMLSVLKDWDSRYQVSMHTEPESSLRYSVHTETKPSAKVLMSSEVDSNVKSSVRRNGEVRRRVTISEEHPAPLAHRATSRALPVTSPEPVYKQSTQRPSENVYTSPGPILKYPESSQGPPVHAKVELTPRPLPPRSLPRYGPESSWWALLNTEVEMPQSRPTTPDFEPPSPSPVDYSMPFFEMDSNPFCEDLIFQREKTHPSPPPPPASPLPPQLPEEPPSRAPLREVPQAPKCTSKPPIQRFSAFFLGM